MQRGRQGSKPRWLARDFDWPESPGPGVAVFTGSATAAEAYREGLAGYGLSRIETL